MGQQIWNGVIYEGDDFEVLKEGDREFLHWKGTQTDLRVYELPKGMTSMHMMFAGTDIEYGPSVIPDGVTDVSYMYLNCKHLIEGSVVPASVTNQDGEYDGCENLTDAKNFSPNVVSINGYAANCKTLENVDYIPDSVEEAESALEGCESVTEVHGGKNVKNADGIYAGMENLEVPSPELNPEASLDDAFVGCAKMEEKFAIIDAEVQQEKMMDKVRQNVVAKAVERQEQATQTTKQEEAAPLDRNASLEAAFGDIVSPSEGASFDHAGK